MTLGKYQVRPRHGMQFEFEIYNILDGDIVCRFKTEKRALEYAKKMNGEG